MDLIQSIHKIFGQLSTTLLKLNDEQYTSKCKGLFDATIGQHVRHITDLFLCLDHGYKTGIINYEKRERNSKLETDRLFAVKTLSAIYNTIQRSNKVLLMEANYNERTENTFFIPTNYYRELVYNLEHTIHHMALIRVGINEISGVQVPKEFGVAISTIKYKRSCAQ